MKRNLSNNLQTLNLFTLSNFSLPNFERLKRYKLKKGNVKLFSILDQHQLKDTRKMKLCDHTVVNNKSLTVLKKNLFNIMKLYE